MKRLLPVIAVVSTVLWLTVNTVQADDLHCFYASDHKNHVEFNSDAPVEIIKGSTNQITGTVCYDDRFTFASPQQFDINFSVDLASIKTGIDMRDQHMRDNFLHTSQYPTAVFKPTKITADAKPPFKEGQTVNIKATGNFTVHGKTVTKTIPLKVTYFPESDLTHKRFKSGNMIRIRGTFPVKLEAHGIERPAALAVKLAETVFVTIDVFASDAK